MSVDLKRFVWTKIVFCGFSFLFFFLFLFFKSLGTQLIGAGIFESGKSFLELDCFFRLCGEQKRMSSPHFCSKFQLTSR